MQTHTIAAKWMKSIKRFFFLYIKELTHARTHARTNVLNNAEGVRRISFRGGKGKRDLISTKIANHFENGWNAQKVLSSTKNPSKFK